MVTFFHDLPCTVEYKGKQYALNLAYNDVLKCLAIREDTSIADELKINWIAVCLIKNSAQLSVRDKAEIVETVFKEYINFNKRTAKDKSSIKTFDFQLDADLIYSSFMQAYKIDLIDLQNKLHWWKFLSLFNGLPSNTKMREVMQIRAKPIPSPTKHNGEEIKALRELKQYYALPNSICGQTYQEGLQALWNTFERQAKQ